MSKRDSAPLADPNMARKRVRIDAVVPLPSEHKQDRCISHPNLISYASPSPPEGMKDINMKFVRKTLENADTSHNGTDYELIANRDGEEWHAKKGYNEMNVDYFIGVMNKKTNVIQLFEVDDEKRTYAEQKADLLQTFGGKRSQKRVAKYEKDRITYEKVDEKARGQVNAAAKEMMEQDMEQGIDHFKVETTEALAPPHDVNASVPEAAYPLEGLMTPGELFALEQEAKSMIETCGDGKFSLENPGWHPMVWHALERICSEKDAVESVRVRRMKAAMHLHYLIVLSKGPKLIKRETRIEFMETMAVDEEILNCLLERFTVPVGAGKGQLRRKTASTSARLAEWGILMWVTTCNFTDCGKVGELCNALGISLKLLCSYAIQLGCKVRKKPGQIGADSYRLALKVPLVFPQLRRKKNRPQKRS